MTYNDVLFSRQIAKSFEQQYYGEVLSSKNETQAIIRDMVIWLAKLKEQDKVKDDDFWNVLLILSKIHNESK